MKYQHAYDQVRNAIGLEDGEPFFILRGNDMLAIPTIYAYRKLLESHQLPRMSDAVMQTFFDWRKSHGVKLPD